MDEAFSKVTRVFEVAIKLRMKTLGIPKTKGSDRLEKKIDLIEPYTTPKIKEQWHKARKVRNIFAHPESGRVFGITVFQSFYQMVNILNTIFLEKSEIERIENDLEKLKNATVHLKQGLFKFLKGPNQYLYWSLIPLSFHTDGNIDKSLWVFHPVLTDFPQTEKKLDFSIPTFLQLTNVCVTTNGLQGRDLNTKEELIIINSDKEPNKNAKIRHDKLIESADEVVKQLYLNFLNEEMSKAVIRFQYNAYWEY